jgi:hypothetical protein
VFENREIKMIYGTKKNEVAGEWKRLQNKELYYLYYSPNNIRVIKIKKNVMGRICSMYGSRKVAYKVRVGGPEEKKPFGRPGHKWEDNIKMVLQEVDEGMDMIDLAQYTGQVAGSCECGNEPLCSIKCGKFLE